MTERSGRPSLYSKETARENIPPTRGFADGSLNHWRGDRPEVRDLPTLWRPNPGPQTLFLQSTAREALIGGAVGGGKTDALVVGPLRWVYHPKFSALILRREKVDLQENIDRAREIYEAVCPGVNWVNQRKRFEFPNGATIQLGAAQYEDDIEDWKTYQFQYIGFDELTTFTRRQYVYMLSRNRSPADADLPTFIRSGTNPDGPGHDWVYGRFVDGKDPFKIYSYRYEIERPDGSVVETEVSRQFIPSTVFDNPELSNRDEYIAGLRSMGKDLSDALLYGKWDYFRGQMFPYELKTVEPGLKAMKHYVIRCMDYGWSDPSVILWLVVYPRPGKKAIVEVAGELVLNETNVDGIAHMALHHEEKLQRTWGLESPRISVIDPSANKSEGTSGGQNIKDMLQAEGLWFEGANNDRQSGWAQLRRLLESDPPRLRFWRGACPYLLSTLPKLVRDPSKADDIRRKQDDHGADTLRYGVHAFADMQGLAESGEPEPRRDPRRDPHFEKILDQVKNGGRRSNSPYGAGF